ncbi:MAG: GlyGly-CTERM sorting domain-containing protein, partial [Mesorhizobium sp.]
SWNPLSLLMLAAIGLFRRLRAHPVGSR